MALFFLVVGLEVSREVTTGELRDRRNVAVPALGALGGLVVPALIYLAFNPSGPASAGWGIVMSTDTAFVVGILALFGPRCPDRLRLFLLTLAIVDDIGAISVMAIFYSDEVNMAALAVAAVLVAVLAGAAVGRRLAAGAVRARRHRALGGGARLGRARHPRRRARRAAAAVPARRPRGRRAHRHYGRALREEPDAERARLAGARRGRDRAGQRPAAARAAPVSAYVVVPVFGLANAGVQLDAETLRAAADVAGDHRRLRGAAWSATPSASPLAPPWRCAPAGACCPAGCAGRT